MSQFEPLVHNWVTLANPSPIQFLPMSIYQGRIRFDIPRVAIPDSNTYFNVQPTEDGGWNLIPNPNKIDHEMWTHLVHAANRHNRTSCKLHMMYNHHAALVEEMNQIRIQLDTNYSNALNLVQSHAQEELIKRIVQRAEAKHVPIEKVEFVIADNKTDPIVDKIDDKVHKIENTVCNNYTVF